jgi:hypothetical protein
MSTDNPAAEAPETTEVEVRVEWQGLQGQPHERFFYITLQRPVAIRNPTYEESYALETKFVQLIPIPWQDWVSLEVSYPSQQDFVGVYRRGDPWGSETGIQVLRNCQAQMWNHADEYQTARFHETPGISMILDLVIDREAVTDWLERIPVTRHLNLKLPKVLRDEQIRKILKILDPVKAIANLQLPDIADAENDEASQ